MVDETAIRSRYEIMRPGLDERGRRLLAAAEARAAGYGGVSAVARATGIARSTIDRGLKDLEALDPAPPKVRRPGGGRPSLAQIDPTLMEDLQRLLEPATVGDPMPPLVWVSKSHAKLAAALRDMGHEVSASRIPKLLERSRRRPAKPSASSRSRRATTVCLRSSSAIAAACAAGPQRCGAGVAILEAIKRRHAGRAQAGTLCRFRKSRHPECRSLFHSIADDTVPDRTGLPLQIPC